MDAVCELTVSSRDFRYSGEMSLKLDYPQTFKAEVYGPFGDTIVSIAKQDGQFSMKTGTEDVQDEERFWDMFHISVDDFINDITLRGNMQQDSTGTSFIQRTYYRVLYELDRPEPTIRWISTQGNIVIKFLEANFEKGRSVGNRSNNPM